MVTRVNATEPRGEPGDRPRANFLTSTSALSCHLLDPARSGILEVSDTDSPGQYAPAPFAVQCVAVRVEDADVGKVGEFGDEVYQTTLGASDTLGSMDGTAMNHVAILSHEHFL